MPQSTANNRPRVIPSRPLLTQNDVRWFFHVTMALYFVRVWVWHVSAESAHRPTRQLFGGYFRYLTICCFTVQVIQLVLATLADMTPYGVRVRLKRLADDLSCVAFVLANIVTLLFYLIEFLLPGGIISKALGGITPWINVSTHILTSIVAWTDIIISHPRRFSPRAFWFLVISLASYAAWISVIRSVTGVYPYGFLNAMPHPHGLIFMVLVCAILAQGFFSLGKYLSCKTSHIMAMEKVEDLDAKETIDLVSKDKTDSAEIDELKLD